VRGLMGSHYVRVYHPINGTDTGTPCSAKNLEPGSLSEPWVYAALLDTSHSFADYNYICGADLGKLHVYGEIAQNYRGPVGDTLGPSGYTKDSKYDGRLAVD